ncbi:MAG: hypothetical protein GY702_23835 [Desulfobulbaceae bacterium]|nr:hypothetical protein [Desulfobulbaceae bacterium]
MKVSTNTTRDQERNMTAKKELRLVLFSFGFKYGSPVDTNFVLDVRLLPNPYWVSEMRHKTGLKNDVADYVLKSKEGEELLDRLNPLLSFLVEQSGVAGKDVLRIGIGCTGGRHRSVAVTEQLASSLRKTGASPIIFHRDIKKDG